MAHVLKLCYCLWRGSPKSTVILIQWAMRAVFSFVKRVTLLLFLFCNTTHCRVSSSYLLLFVKSVIASNLRAPLLFKQLASLKEERHLFIIFFCYICLLYDREKGLYLLCLSLNTPLPTRPWSRPRSVLKANRPSRACRSYLLTTITTAARTVLFFLLFPTPHYTHR